MKNFMYIVNNKYCIKPDCMLLLKGRKDAIKISVQENNFPHSFVSLNGMNSMAYNYRPYG
ncbi:hypothetical protein HMPREF1212_00738 [Parabacteroides sp. HGS0025]|nr:hypothetical protein HMPREF1212_00738 [Parabacteroides sp. HGS0025]